VGARSERATSVLSYAHTSTIQYRFGSKDPTNRSKPSSSRAQYFRRTLACRPCSQAHSSSRQSSVSAPGGFCQARVLGTECFRNIPFRLSELMFRSVKAFCVGGYQRCDLWLYFSFWRGSTLVTNSGLWRIYMANVLRLQVRGVS
jgi:hypothetical protein